MFWVLAYFFKEGAEEDAHGHLKERSRAYGLASSPRHHFHPA